MPWQENQGSGHSQEAEMREVWSEKGEGQVGLGPQPHLDSGPQHPPQIL